MDETANFSDLFLSAYIINHVFLPPQLPQEDDFDVAEERALCVVIEGYAREYAAQAFGDRRRWWEGIAEMLDNQRISHETGSLAADHVSGSLAEMKDSDVLCFVIHAQNAAVIVRKCSHSILFESFEISPPAAKVMSAKGRLLCSYPGPAITVPEEITDDPSFLIQLASFLAQMDVDILDSAATTQKAQTTVVEERDTAHPKYITQLLTGILRGVGNPADVIRIQKRVADDVLWKDAKKPWRRSPLWLVLRATIQTTLYRETSSHLEYKTFMLFAMAKMLNQILDLDFPSDLLFHIRAKISRRLYKLGESARASVACLVLGAVKATDQVLSTRWSRIQSRQAESPRWAPRGLDLSRDSKITFPNSKLYLSKVLQGTIAQHPSQSFKANHSPRLYNISEFNRYAGGGLKKCFAIEPVTALADFEMSVQYNIDGWVTLNVGSETSCAILTSCIEQYSTAALDFYKSSPEALSMMLLTIFELWVALDKVAVAQCPLLREYSPEVPLRLLNPLLLRHAASLARLDGIEQYLRLRRHNVDPNKSIFKDTVDRDTFAVRYFCSSPPLQSLRERIENDAKLTRERKLAELRSKNIEYSLLIEIAESEQHIYDTNRRGVTYHWRNMCMRCDVESKARSMEIAVHEWPLPEDPLMAAVVVFELACPLPFAMWRATTFHILANICSRPGKEHLPAQPPIQLVNYPGFDSYISSDNSIRITLASTTKSFKKSHYGRVRIPADNDAVCLRNALQYRLYDKDTDTWAAGPFDCDIQHYCTLQLPQSGPYKSLQFGVDTTSHESNHVIAMQYRCPIDLDLHEYLAFTGLRSGHRLQWMNIAREIRSRTLSFHRQEVHTLITQAVWQVGPALRDGTRVSHLDLTCVDFCLLLIRELGDLLNTIRSNWQEIATVSTIIALTHRLLATTNDRNVILVAYDLLRSARVVSFGWAKALGAKVQEIEEDSTVLGLQVRICEAAATCRYTFDIEPNHFPHLLNSADDLSVLIQCAILVHDNAPRSASTTPYGLKRLLQRNTRLSHSLEHHTRHLIEIHSQGLDTAIKALWTAFRPHSEWLVMSSPNERWVVAKSAVEPNQRPQSVQLNILSGQLLVNGYPLGRLPGEIIKHATYKVLDIVPADMPGMDYATRFLISNHQLYFALKQNNLVVRAKHGSDIFELIPHTQLVEDLPRCFIDDCVHWLNIKNGQMEMRPKSAPWESSSSNWVAKVTKDGESSVTRALTHLIDIHSPTFRMISTLLKPIEEAKNLVISWSLDTDSLSIELPRFRLLFTMNNDNLLECQNMPGMVIDSNQSSGSLFGLVNQLVLRTKDDIHKRTPPSRIVIIPYGQIRFEHQRYHTRATVETKSQTSVKYLEYKVDSTLGRLVGNVSLVSRLYKIYLHAVTSHCLPDPLTGHTGTEEALRDLRGAGCQSFQSLGIEEIRLLRHIAALAPLHTFYPRDMQVMQQIEWLNLPSMAQQFDFYTTTHSIMQHADRLNIFYQNTEAEGKGLKKGGRSDAEIHLSERAKLRTVVYNPVDLAAYSDFSKEDNDVTYFSRDNAMPDLEEGQANSESAAFAMSHALYHWRSSYIAPLRLLDMFEEWQLMGGFNPSATFSYHRDWLSLNLADNWMSLYELCRRCSHAQDQFTMIFSFSSLAYTSPSARQPLQILLAFAVNSDRLRGLDTPMSPSFDLGKGFSPNAYKLREAISLSTFEFEDSPEAEYEAYDEESDVEAGERCVALYEARVAEQTTELVDILLCQWPCEEPILEDQPSDGESWRFDMEVCSEQIQAFFKDWFQNKQLHLHTTELQRILESFPISALPNVALYHFATSHSQCGAAHSPNIVPTAVDQLMQRNSPLLANDTPKRLNSKGIETQRPQSLIVDDRLKALIIELRGSRDSFHRHYGNALDDSRKDLINDHVPNITVGIPYSLATIASYQNDCRAYFETVFTSIQRTLAPRNTAETVLSVAGLWPRYTFRSILEMMTLKNRPTLSQAWRRAFTTMAMSMLIYQRSCRLLKWAVAGNADEFSKELENDALHQREEKMTSFDWLLIQLDGDFLARPLQIRVAQEMISPSSSASTLLQLNMGEGKSSVIVPMVATALADSEKLVRVVVLKSLSKQMFHLLVERLCGLANRQIFYLPFSRSVKMEAEQASLIHDLYEQCMGVGGILVAQPEHMLSFKLMGLERLLNSSISTPGRDRHCFNTLLASQRWLEKHSRDVLDESDEILHIRYQLIYTMGQQRAIEDSPGRWVTIQQVLSLARKHAGTIKHQFPLHIEVQESPTRPGSYPFLRILSDEAAAALQISMAQDIIAGALSEGLLGVWPVNIREAAYRVITDLQVSMDDVRPVQSHCKESGAWGELLLLRGLLAHGVLAYALKERRWRVDYGLDPTRTLLAVPYRAKDVPALRAEFGHPDVAIMLTTLAYYYSGLTPSQVDLCLQLLLKLDNPHSEYDKWLKCAEGVPKSLQRVNGINLSDSEQRQQHIFPLFFLNPAVVDFYLTMVVFPKEAKEFPEKLATSGWDLAEKKTNLITGFSGTNDNRYLLPISIKQRDPLHQSATNAKVLSYLLQPENDDYLCVQTLNGEYLTTKAFLHTISLQRPRIHVLLDVGAQMLDMQNVELVRFWLSLVPDVPAALFFDNDEACILTRDDTTAEPFMSSSFNQQLDKCLVYLDDVHTRGTDLKLSRNSRAAVTLGPKVTKDRLVQGCMRMRMLGHGQSVMFFAPLEVDRAIRKAANLLPSAAPRTTDILRWAMLGTCSDIRHHIPHWAQQGVDHKLRSEAWLHYSLGHTNAEDLRSAWLQPEARSLEAMYGPSHEGDHATTPLKAVSVPEIERRCQAFGMHNHFDTRVEEEQEREVDHEIEKERQVQRPGKAEAAPHVLDDAVRQFVHSGKITSSRQSFLSMSSSLEISTGTKKSSITNDLMWSPNVFATKDYSTTIRGSANRTSDYLRPLNWIVSSRTRDGLILVIMSPHEVNILLPKIRSSKMVHLHIFAPRVAQAMKPFDDLKFFCVPSLSSDWMGPPALISLQIQLLSGQLYLSDHVAYTQLCEFLGLCTPAIATIINFTVKHDGFIKPSNRRSAAIMRQCPFKTSPVPFLMQLYAMRRKGLGFSSTHIGKILRGRQLTESDFGES
ncbi:hypothetical protein HWV62_4673 [Athelia sp. TMB]|nr:hypothetical protein HWV62_4673 [Athelia sp. TMB]